MVNQFDSIKTIKATTVGLCLLLLGSMAEAFKVPSLTECGTMAIILTEKPYQALTSDLKGQKLTLHEANNKNRPFTLQLADKLGAGYFGAVYLVEKTSLESLNYSFPIVVKFPHSMVVAPDIPFFFSVSENNKEAEFYKKIHEAIGSIQSQEGYPKDPAWNNGTLPIVPLLNRIVTERGPLLFKPVIKGAKFLSDLAPLYRQNGMKLPSVYVEALREIYDLTQAVFSATGVCIDLRPPNMVYIDDPKVFSVFGLKRAGFILFEMSAVVGNVPAFIGPQHPFSEFLAQFEAYLKKEK